MYCVDLGELSNEYLVAKIGFDTAENGPCKVCGLVSSSSFSSGKHSSEVRIEAPGDDASKRKDPIEASTAARAS